MGCIGKIQFGPTCDMNFVRNIFTSLMETAQCDLSKAALSFYFREPELIDRIFSETDIEYIEGFTWAESRDIEEIIAQIRLNDLLSLRFVMDEFEISACLLQIDLLPEHFSQQKLNHANVQIRKNMKTGYSLNEENEAKLKLKVLCQKVFGDISTLSYICSHGSGTDSVAAWLYFPFSYILESVHTNESIIIANKINPAKTISSLS